MKAEGWTGGPRSRGQVVEGQVVAGSRATRRARARGGLSPQTPHDGLHTDEAWTCLPSPGPPGEHPASDTCPPGLCVLTLIPTQVTPLGWATWSLEAQLQPPVGDYSLREGVTCGTTPQVPRCASLQGRRPPRPAPPAAALGRAMIPVPAAGSRHLGESNPQKLPQHPRASAASTCAIS